jgi:predicted ArsR family transcriptional regulator
VYTGGAAGCAKAHMHSTKSQILSALKRRGRCTVDELAAGLGLASMTVRQHLATLERDELVASEEERQRLGRPHFVYFLTDKGEASFPVGYDKLAARLIRAVGDLDSSEIAGLSSEEKTALLFDKLAAQFVDRHGADVQRLSLPERVAAVAALLQQESGFAEWIRTSDGYEILDYNCFFRRLNGLNGEPCRWHARVLSELLDQPVESRAASPASAQLCRFAVRARPEADKKNGSHAGLSAASQRAGAAASAVPRDAV